MVGSALLSPDLAVDQGLPDPVDLTLWDPRGFPGALVLLGLSRLGALWWCLASPGGERPLCLGKLLVGLLLWDRARLCVPTPLEQGPQPL